MNDIINYIATALSIIGGCIAIWQAYIATTEATKVEKFRDEIITVRKAVDFSSIETILTRVINQISKYGPASQTSSLFGVNPEKDAHEVLAFVTTLRKKILFDGYLNEIDKFCDELSTLIENLVSTNSSDAASMKKNGTLIYHRLTDFSSVLKGNLDLPKEKSRK